ncbi:MAG TPA: 23S rRNA (adenine(2030)-N(6))-methyltransferase RlmJ [Lacunisphaera sp.]|jgi:23S rRNA (adenine2030-N6)-methyltransferase|nr:23S rRNA (adenine(2030)-N(6))-methyltransferase RlmJ [Lacunisphaera sp.]
MNYRHHFHAGNFADVFKHVLLLRLIAAMQRKEKGFLYLDTHAGRGGYDLSVPATLPEGRVREPEFPQGIGRLWEAEALPAPLAGYVELVRRYNERQGVAPRELKYYPGSPWLAKFTLRPQDRLALFELHPDDVEALEFEFGREPRVSVQAGDGYHALKGALPPPEKRALVLIDPPFENQGEFAAILGGLEAALRRLPGAVLAVWYPITERAGTDAFLREITARPTPALAAEMMIAGPQAAMRLKGCGLLVLNPPWRIETEFREILPELAQRLEAGEASARCTWLVADR